MPTCDGHNPRLRRDQDVQRLRRLRRRRCAGAASAELVLITIALQRRQRNAKGQRRIYQVLVSRIAGVGRRPRQGLQASLVSARSSLFRNCCAKDSDHFHLPDLVSDAEAPSPLSSCKCYPTSTSKPLKHGVTA